MWVTGTENPDYLIRVALSIATFQDGQGMKPKQDEVETRVHSWGAQMFVGRKEDLGAVREILELGLRRQRKTDSRGNKRSDFEDTFTPCTVFLQGSAGGCPGKGGTYGRRVHARG